MCHNMHYAVHMQHFQTNPLVVYLTKPLVNRYWNYNPLIWTLEWPLCLTIGQFDNLTIGQFDFQSHLLLVAKLAAIGVTLVGHLVTWLMS